MYDLLKILLDAAIKAFNPEAIERFRREAKQRALGTSFFRLYIALVDMITNGEQLLIVLRRVTRRKARIQASATEANLENQALVRILQRQSEKLETILNNSQILHLLCWRLMPMPPALSKF